MQKIKVEDQIDFKVHDNQLEAISDLYQNFYNYRNQRDTEKTLFQNMGFDEMLTRSREMFWNSTITESQDLAELGLEFNFPFIRKEVLEFLGRIVSLKISPQITSDSHAALGAKVLQGIYKKYRIKNQDHTEKFWQVLYGIVNGTVCLYVWFDGREKQKRFLEKYDPEKGEYKIVNRDHKEWNDIRVEVVPIEEMYLADISLRKINDQSEVIRKREYTKARFDQLFGHYQNAKYVQGGQFIDEESLYYKLLSGTNILGQDRVQILSSYNIAKDYHIMVANGILLNPVGNDVSPNPFHHKAMPYVWSVGEAIDEKFAYGLPMPIKLGSQQKLLNVSYTMLLENELRGINRPYITSDFDAPNITFGDKQVIPVTDVNAWKPLEVPQTGTSYFSMMNSLQGLMTMFAQGGSNQVAPSVQPRAAREVVAIENMKQQALGATLIHYFDLVYQELILVLKTALQFYGSEHYRTSDKADLVRAISIPEFPLSEGGLGTLEVKFVTKKSDDIKRYFDAVNRSIENGKKTEIIEVAIEALTKIEFFIDDIKLEAEKATELERAAYFEQVLSPMINVFIPAGIASMEKTYLRFLEKMGESPSDYTDDNMMAQMYTTMQNKLKVQQPVQPAPAQGNPLGNANSGTLNGDLMQSVTGQRFGGQSAGGFPELQQ